MTDYPDLLARHRYALIDRINLWAESWHEELPLIPVVPRILRGDEESMPALLPLEANAAWFEDLLNHLEIAESRGRKPLLSCLLAVPDDTDLQLLVENLKRRLIINSPQGRALLRYYDSNVFPHFRRIFSSEQLQALYGPVTAWTFRFRLGWMVDRDMLSRGVERKKMESIWVTEASPGLTDNVPEEWQVTAEQRAALDRVGALNQALEVWREKTRPWKNIAEYREMAVRANAVIARMQLEEPNAREGVLAYGAFEFLQELVSPEAATDDSANQ